MDLSPPSQASGANRAPGSATRRRGPCPRPASRRWSSSVGISVLCRVMRRPFLEEEQRDHANTQPIMTMVTEEPGGRHDRFVQRAAVPPKTEVNTLVTAKPASHACREHRREGRRDGGQLRNVEQSQDRVSEDREAVVLPTSMYIGRANSPIIENHHILLRPIRSDRDPRTGASPSWRSLRSGSPMERLVRVRWILVSDSRAYRSAACSCTFRASYRPSPGSAASTR